MNSEQYRQMLVRDGERRFREWHQSFLAYQQRFQQAMAAKQLAAKRAAATQQMLCGNPGAQAPTQIRSEQSTSEA